MQFVKKKSIILFLTQLLTSPPNSGGKIIAFELLKILSRNHQVYLYCFSDNSYRNKNNKNIKRFCKSIHVEEQPIIYFKNRAKLIIKYIYSIITFKSYLWYKYHSKNMHKSISKLLDKRRIDLILVNHDTMFQYIPSSYKGKVIYNSVDQSSDLFNQYAHYENNFFKKIVYYLEYIKLLRLEKVIFQKSDYIYSVSLKDIDNIKHRGVLPSRIGYLPIKFDIINCYKTNKLPTLLFLGSLTWKPNTDGINWFIQEIFPLILKQISTCKIVIAGDEGNQYIKNSLYSDKINFHTSISHNDQESIKLYKNSSVFIVPIRIGSGIRIKLLDAMSHGIPVVSTSKGTEGINLISGEELLIADNHVKFAEAVVKILNDTELGKKLSANGINFIKRHFNKKNMVEALSIIYNY